MDDRFDLENAIQRKAEFPCANPVMDKVGGWEEEYWVGSRFAACMWIFTKAVICNAQNHMQNYRLLEFKSIMEAENWVCDDALGRHMCVSELTISCEEAKVLEALQYDLANPCIVQWGMLWFSAPTSPNNDLLNDGVILEKYNEAVILAILATFTMPLWRMHTPRSCFLRSLRTVWTNTPESLERGQRYEGMGTW